MKDGHMTIEFPASGLVVTSTAPTFVGYPAQFFRLGPDGPQPLRWQPKNDEVRLVTQYFGTPIAYAKNRTATLRLVERTFVGTNAEMKGISHSMSGVHHCPPGIVHTY